MGSDYINLTRGGRDKLCEELDSLKGDKRREIAKALDEARSHGDLSENAEYDAAKEAQAMNERRVSELEDILIRARLIDETKISKDEALLSATVTVRDLGSGEEFDYMLVSEEESDYDMDKISITSPVGEAILGHKVGDIVEIQIPAGILKYEIMKIS
ncbi:MAG: transcription elongation factor GreA [Candidatus Omnitrophica bacterium]|nr:transcription elongation factor GreA [Candidatus Omnitrophota bacterium]